MLVRVLKTERRYVGLVSPLSFHEDGRREGRSPAACRQPLCDTASLQRVCFTAPNGSCDPTQPTLAPGLRTAVETCGPTVGWRWEAVPDQQLSAVGKASKPGAARVWPQNHTPTPGLGDIKLSLSSLPNHLQQQKYLSEAIAGVRQKANQSRALLGQLRSGVGDYGSSVGKSFRAKSSAPA